MKFTAQQQAKILELAAIIAAQNLEGGYLKTRQEAVRCIFSAMQLVSLTPVVLEAVEKHPQLAVGNGKDVINIASDYVITHANAKLAEIHEAEQAEQAEAGSEGDDDES